MKISIMYHLILLFAYRHELVINISIFFPNVFLWTLDIAEQIFCFEISFSVSHWFEKLVATEANVSVKPIRVLWAVVWVEFQVHDDISVSIPQKQINISSKLFWSLPLKCCQIKGSVNVSALITDRKYCLIRFPVYLEN